MEKCKNCNKNTLIDNIDAVYPLCSKCMSIFIEEFSKTNVGDKIINAFDKFVKSKMRDKKIDKVLE